eukprot:3503683-Pyramimonas_sp.AAC.1
MECAAVKTRDGLVGWLQARQRPMALQTPRGLRPFLRISEPERRIRRFRRGPVTRRTGAGPGQ